MSYVALDLLNGVAAAATALGVAFGAFQLFQSQRQAVAAFEDTLASEYRALGGQLPPKAMLGEELVEKEREAAFDEFFRYFDLTNGQIFLRQIGRVSRKTWVFWSDGIRSNLARPAFEAAWKQLSARAPNDFHELRRFIQEGQACDPRRWRK
jgi:hypothetical protein